MVYIFCFLVLTFIVYQSSWTGKTKVLILGVFTNLFSENTYNLSCDVHEHNNKTLLKHMQVWKWVVGRHGTSRGNFLHHTRKPLMSWPHELSTLLVAEKIRMCAHGFCKVIVKTYLLYTIRYVRTVLSLWYDRSDFRRTSAALFRECICDIKLSFGVD